MPANAITKPASTAVETLRMLWNVRSLRASEVARGSSSARVRGAWMTLLSTKRARRKIGRITQNAMMKMRPSVACGRIVTSEDICT